MGIFSRSASPVSENIDKQNALLNSNKTRLYERLERLWPDNLVGLWLSVAAPSVSSFLEIILFGKYEFTLEDGRLIKDNPFQKHLDKLTSEKTLEFSKLIAGEFLSAYLEDQYNLYQLGKDWYPFENMESSVKTFKENVFLIFEFTAEDKALYEELAKKRVWEGHADYFIALYQLIFRKVYGIPAEEQDIGVLWLARLLPASYETLLNTLTKQVQDFKDKM